MRYPHQLVITRPGAGAQDPDTGAWVPGAATTVYDDLADVQDAGVVVEQKADGTPVRRSDAEVFLKDESGIGGIKVGDDAVVTWEDGTTADAKVSLVRRLDGALGLEWV